MNRSASESISDTNLLKGRSVKVYGVGVNDADYVVKKRVNGELLSCPYYKTWAHLMRRNYSKAYQTDIPHEVPTTICEEWLYFMAFRKWAVGQVDNDMFFSKDLLVQGNTRYEPDTCIYIPSNIRSLVVDHTPRSNKLPVGVYWRTTIPAGPVAVLSPSYGKYKVSCRDDSGKLKYLGYYLDLKEAANTYIEYKYTVLSKIASTQREPIREALLRWRLETYDEWLLSSAGDEWERLQWMYT